MKTLHLICNAHLDPVWQWSWEEGAAAAVSTFSAAVNLSEKYDFVFCHNEALLYEWIKEYVPELFKKIQSLVKKGKWKIIGGWYLQPDCNLPCGEAIVRQISVGREFFNKYFKSKPSVAVNFDSFGHSAGLPQILKKSGYNAYICSRPHEYDIPQDDFIWIGCDGSSIAVNRNSEGYNSLLGHAKEKIEGYINAFDDKKEIGIVLWGVGNHGGGPSEEDLKAIETLQKQSKVQIIHSTPEKYFENLDKSALPEYHKSLNRCMTGCYTSQPRLKRAYRELENNYFRAEKICAASDMLGYMKYPRSELRTAEKDMLFSEFHDILTGTSVEAAEKSSLCFINHGIEICERVAMRAFMSFATNLKKTENDCYPVVVLNARSEYRTDIFECEFMLKDQNWNENEITGFDVYADDKLVKSQLIKENSNINLDWRKKLIIEAPLKPFTVNYFKAVPKLISKSIKTRIKNDFVFENNFYKFILDGKTGLISINSDNMEFVHNGGKIVVYKDNEDPWIMQGECIAGFKEKINEFVLMSETEAKSYCGNTSAEPIRIIEEGEVFTEIELLFTCKNSSAVVRYRLFNRQKRITLEVILDF